MTSRSLLSRVLCTVLCLLFFALPICAESTDGIDEEVTLPSLAEANAVYFYHCSLGMPMFTKNEAEVVAAGSSVKVLAGLILCEEFSERMEEEILVTKEMLADVAGYSLKLKGDEILTVEQLLYAAVCGSYNDAYCVLACYLDGSVSAFAERMNARAAELGATQSVFTEPCGTDDTSKTSAQDQFKIALAALDNKVYMEICSTAKYPVSTPSLPNVSTIRNRNALISSTTTTQYYNGKCNGMSAGWTEKGGNCVITVATIEDQSFVCVILGGEDIEDQNYGYILANRLIDWTADNYSMREVLSPETDVGSIPVSLSAITASVKIRATESFSFFLPTSLDLETDLTYSLRLKHGSLEAPVSEGTYVGQVAILYGSTLLGTADLYTIGSAERHGFIGSMKWLENLLSNRPIFVAIVFFVLALVGWITTEQIIRHRRRHKWDKYFSKKMTLSQTEPKNRMRPKK